MSLYHRRALRSRGAKGSQHTAEAAQCPWETGRSLDPCKQGVSDPPSHPSVPICALPSVVGLVPSLWIPRGRCWSSALSSLQRHLTLSAGPVMWLPSRATC